MRMQPIQKQLYQTQCIEGDWDAHSKRYDFLLIAAGHDYRAYEILRQCKTKDVAKNVLVFDFEERHILTLDKSSYYNTYKELGFNTSRISCTVRNPSDCIKHYAKSKLNFKNNHKIALDISCFTKPYFFSLIKYLKEECKLDSITIFYTEPMSYKFSRGLYNAYHSTSGSLSVMEIPGFPGIETRPGKKILVVLLGFDGELASFITEVISPNEVVIVNGFPAYLPKFKDISLLNNDKLINYSDARRKTRYVRANNPFETFNLLEDLKMQEKDAIISIAPIGTKPMALGACMFATMYQDIRIIYPYPEQYAAVTTDKCWHSWSYEIPLNML
jgi:hypothetical protein